MPAPETLTNDFRPSLGHVNLMVDTLIANSNVDDLRAIIRGLLATGTPGLASAFTTAARCRFRQTNAKTLPPTFSYFVRSNDGVIVPTSQLYDVLTRARSLYGAGMGFASLGILASVVRATLGFRWEEDGVMADILAEIDADISQAIQSSREEIEGGRVVDFGAAREALDELRSVVQDSFADVATWGGEFPFERASFGMDFLKV